MAPARATSSLVTVRRQVPTRSAGNGTVAADVAGALVEAAAALVPAVAAVVAAAGAATAVATAVVVSDSPPHATISEVTQSIAPTASHRASTPPGRRRRWSCRSIADVWGPILVA